MTPTAILRDSIRIALSEGAMTPDQRREAQTNMLLRMLKLAQESAAEMAELSAIVEMLAERPSAEIIPIRRTR